MKKFVPLLLSIMLLSTFSFSQRGRRPAVQEPVQQTSPEVYVPASWEVDRDHSSILFSIDHLGISQVYGLFTSFSGKMTFSKPDYSDAMIGFSAQVNSVFTSNDLRDEQLKGSGFFYAANHPFIQFESTNMKSQGTNKYRLTGNLTIRGISKPVTFSVVHTGTITVLGSEKKGFEAESTINKNDFNLSWNQNTDAGVPVIGDQIYIMLNLEFNKSM